MQRRSAIAAGAAFLFAGLGASRPAGGQHTPARSARTRIGTFDRDGLARAWYGSETFRSRLARIDRERRRIEAEGDEGRAAELEAREAALRQRAAEGCADEETLDEILEVLRPQLPRVAEEAEVHAIAGRILHMDVFVEEVDVSDILARHLG